MLMYLSINKMMQGEHVILTDAQLEGPTCGILPIGTSRANLWTTGLEWNLDGHETRFGGMVSTSNLLASDTVTIRVTAPVVWTAALQ
jgi:thiamine pyrophosphokinase